MASFLRLNRTGNGYLVPALGYPLLLNPQTQFEARGIITKSTSSVSAIVKADKQADVHLALYCAPLTVSGADSELIAQADAFAVMSSEQTIAVDVPTGSLAGTAIAPAGTITVTASSTSVTGSGTAFPTDGQWTGYEIQVKNGPWYQIASVTSATVLVLTGPAAIVSAGAGAFYVRRPSPAAFVVRLWVDHVVGGTVETVLRDTSITTASTQPQVPGGISVSSIVVT